ncbi:MAG: hypothetical protein AMS16_00230 [Planctomycetes bacterium DG_58]|nr:MAG: hypothetical protein AMS16_00230 [Planctomycetes bacterium DG_58]KPL04691.1 MAG: hypothetical protein AMK75_00830 [Planctomycetes bacterium SM23_65]
MGEFPHRRRIRGRSTPRRRRHQTLCRHTPQRTPARTVFGCRRLASPHLRPSARRLHHKFRQGVGRRGQETHRRSGRSGTAGRTQSKPEGGGGGRG